MYKFWQRRTPSIHLQQCRIQNSLCSIPPYTWACVWHAGRVSLWKHDALTHMLCSLRAYVLPYQNRDDMGLATDVEQSAIILHCTPRLLQRFHRMRLLLLLLLLLLCFADQLRVLACASLHTTCLPPIEPTDLQSPIR